MREVGRTAQLRRDCTAQPVRPKRQHTQISESAQIRGCWPGQLLPPEV